jgi:hypothetical protein
MGAVKSAIGWEDEVWGRKAPAPKLRSKRKCRFQTLERLLEVLIAKELGAVVTANLLVERCKACGRCKEMPPPI